jgi:hypothetical protein
MSVILAAFMAAWAVGQYRVAHETGYIATSALSVAAAIGLAVYGVAAERKVRGL